MKLDLEAIRERYDKYQEATCKYSNLTGFLKNGARSELLDFNYMMSCDIPALLSYIEHLHTLIAKENLIDTPVDPRDAKWVVPDEAAITAAVELAYFRRETERLRAENEALKNTQHKIVASMGFDFTQPPKGEGE